MESKPTLLKIAVTGGGTGGHVEPLVAVIHELKKTPVEMIWIGQKKSFESQAAEKEQIRFKPVVAGKLRRYFALENALDAFKVVVGYIQALFIFLSWRPDVVFSKAGYVSVPALLAAATLRIPVVAHESDTVIGLSNHIASLVAKRFCTGFPLPFYSHTFAEKTIFTGNPVRAHSHLEKTHHSIPTIFITGGSQGALPLNEVVWKVLPRLLEFTRVVHAVGNAHVKRAAEVSDQLDQKLKERYTYSGYFGRDQLDEIFAKVDLAIARAGANSIADFSEFGIPAILVPLPTAASNHQFTNAQYVKSHHAGVLLAQVDLTPDRLVQEVKELLDNDSKRKAMAHAMQHINPDDAAMRIAQEVLAIAKG